MFNWTVELAMPKKLTMDQPAKPSSSAVQAYEFWVPIRISTSERVMPPPSSNDGFGPCRLRAASDTAPMSAPVPKADIRNPKDAASRWSSWRANTGTRTLKFVPKIVTTATSRIVTRTTGVFLMYPIASRISAMM